MKFLLYIKEVELLTELEYGCLEPCFFDPDTRFLNMDESEYYELVASLFDCISLLQDKVEQWTLSQLGARIVKCLAVR